ncbi:transcriptional regulator [Marinobacterium zhoushanense]|uniref:Transcriptional regulator n=1 Tax=Marinobacterium zhoushanense TaxID=1679163 RepID=A0ABQ1KVE7_9GAMM|nr:RodZ family helix-turn-helix domain-containing protein [Marinobacterium zhoushanense]GGC11734.1 transcriptional regulator [Marinobacterium zhoushanense]
MSSEEENPSVGQSFPGGDFADARHALGLSFDQLTRELRLPAKTLESIEAGRFEALGGAVFIRGYIRSYARRLKLEPDYYVALYDQSVGAKDTRSAVRMVGTVSTTPARQSRSLMRFGTLIFVLAIIGTVVWWWQTQNSIDAVITTDSSAPVTVDTADGNTLVLPPLDDGVLGEGESYQSLASDPFASGAAGEPAGESQAEPETPEEAAAEHQLEEDVVEQPAARAAVEEAPTNSAEEVATGIAVLHLVLAEDSWLSVKDASGRSLFNGIAKSGQELNLEGEEPLAVVIGRASAVGVIEYGGEPVDIDSVSNKNVARLTLPVSER